MSQSLFQHLSKIQAENPTVINTNDKITKFFNLSEGEEFAALTEFNATNLGKIMNRDFGDKADLLQVNTLEEFEKFEWFKRLKEILQECNIDPNTLQSLKFYFSYNSYGGGFREEHRYIGIPQVFVLYFEVSDSW